MMALGIIGLLAFLVCLGMVIVNKVRKKPVKYWLIGAPIALILFIVGVSAGPTPSAPPTLAPTQAPTSTLTASEQSYVDTITDQSSRLSTAFSKLGELLQNFQLRNDEWTINVATQLDIIKQAYDEAMAIEPPNSMTEIHYKYVQGMKHFHTMIGLITEGIDNIDASLILEANNEMETGTQYILEAARLMTEFMENKQ